MISRTAAKRQAHQESGMYRQGASGSWWVVKTCQVVRDAIGVGVHVRNVVSVALPFADARSRLAAWRRERAEQLLNA